MTEANHNHDNHLGTNSDDRAFGYLLNESQSADTEALRTEEGAQDSAIEAAVDAALTAPSEADSLDFLINARSLIAGMSSGSLARVVDETTKVARVRSCMGLDKAEYHAISWYRLESTENHTRTKLCEALQRLDHVSFTCLSTSDLMFVFEATCRLVDLEIGSDAHQRLEASVLWPRLKVRKADTQRALALRRQAAIDTVAGSVKADDAASMAAQQALEEVYLAGVVDAARDASKVRMKNRILAWALAGVVLAGGAIWAKNHFIEIGRSSALAANQVRGTASVQHDPVQAH